MPCFRVKTLLDITQPLLNHEYTKKIPSVLKAVVEISPDRPEGQVAKQASAKPPICIVYIETQGIEIGKGSVFQYPHALHRVIDLSKAQIYKQTPYALDVSLINALLLKARSEEL